MPVRPIAGFLTPWYPANQVKTISYDTFSSYGGPEGTRTPVLHAYLMQAESA